MKRGGPDNPKVKQLAGLLNVEIYSAVGLLELLWHFTAKYAPQGDVGRYSDEVIAEAVHWHRRSGKKGVPTEVSLRSALVHAGFLDTCPCHRLVVHDWPEHADQSVARMLARRRLAFVHPPTSLPEPKPEPEPLTTATTRSSERAVAGEEPARPPASELANGLAELGIERGSDLREFLPPETIVNEYGRKEPNPEYGRVQAVLKAAKPRIDRAKDPAAYAKSVLLKEGLLRKPAAR